MPVTGIYNYNTNIYRNYTNKSQEKSGTADFKTSSELMGYLSETYEVVQKGMANISGSYLEKCLTDDKELSRLYDTLENADLALKDAEENIKGFQSMKVTIDEDGNAEYETSSGSVTFNEQKRARQLAAAKTPAQVRMVLSLLNTDLSDCKNGVAKGMCDEAEVAKVEAMLSKAQQKLGQVSGQDHSEEEKGADMFYINMLL